jgi:hypothetical protein
VRALVAAGRDAEARALVERTVASRPDDAFSAKLRKAAGATE